MTVGAGLAPELASGSGAYVTLPLLLAIQAYRDGFAVPELGGVGDGPAPPVSAHPLFRLYTRSIRDVGAVARSEEHTSELQSLMRISYAVFCLKKKNNT